MKVLIVDDEAIVRLGMQHIIPWEQHGYEVVGTASNGLEALEMAKTHMPDIALVDIVMPEMDGLEFIHKLHGVLPLCKIIILSCREDVEYYKKAIKEGVSEYIQKSLITPDEILQAVDRISAEIMKQRVFDSNDSDGKVYVNQNIILTEFFNSVLRGEIKGHDKIEKKLRSFNFSLLSNRIYIIVFSPDKHEDGEGANDPAGGYKGEYDYSLINVSQHITNEMTQGFIFKNYSGKITALVFLPDDDSGKDFIKTLFYRIQQTAGQLFYLDMTAGVSDIMRDFDGICEGYRQALESIDEKYKDGPGKIYFHKSPVKNNEKLEMILKIKESILNINYSFELSLISEKLKEISRLYMESGHITSNEYKSVIVDVLYHISNILHMEETNINDIIGEEFNPIRYVEGPSNLHKLSLKMEYLLERIRKYHTDMYSDKSTKFVSLINTYIQNHISEKIALEDISKAVYLSPSYISRLYKKKTGVNIQDYIIRAKVEKSKELLYKNKNLNEVSESVGFLSISHFFKVFKAYTGLTPGEYLKKEK